MKGTEIFKNVCTMLGCYDYIENTDNGKRAAFVNMINQICADLKIKEITGLSEEIPLEEKQKEALIYGCAMLLSVTLRDAGCAEIYTRLYNSKRAKALCSSDTRADTLPKPFLGGM